MFFSDVYSSFEKVQKQKLGMIFRKIDPSLFSGLRVLDIGCGTCVFESFLLNALGKLPPSGGSRLPAFVCIDPDEKMLSRAPRDVRRSPSVEIINTSYRKFSYSCEEEFDAVVCIDSLHLLSEDITAFLKPSGLALVSMFFNEMDYAKRKALVMSSLQGCRVLNEFVLPTREKEIVVLARKHQ